MISRSRGSGTRTNDGSYPLRATVRAAAKWTKIGMGWDGQCHGVNVTNTEDSSNQPQIGSLPDTALGRGLPPVYRENGTRNFQAVLPFADAKRWYLRYSNISER